MTTDPVRTGWRRPLPRRVFALGCLAGFLLPVPAVALALLFPLGERLLPVLTPGVWLLRPLSSAMAGWPGGLTAAGVLLLPPFPPEMTVFRRQYIRAIVEQLRAGGRGDDAAS